ncbi:hypothetical protein C8R45DRAFT_1095384 [Mycena sanguinolenta]|nr:hypothetical protein C8R45DRAFT_1095384 [Mycena sanguinolenta]
MAINIIQRHFDNFADFNRAIRGPISFSNPSVPPPPSNMSGNIADDRAATPIFSQSSNLIGHQKIPSPAFAFSTPPLHPHLTIRTIVASTRPHLVSATSSSSLFPLLLARALAHPPLDLALHHLRSPLAHISNKAPTFFVFKRFKGI